MKKIISILYFSTLIVLTACGGGSGNKPSDVEDPPKNKPDTQKEVSNNSPEIEQLVVNYSPPAEIISKIGNTEKLTFSVKVKTDDFEGEYAFFDCVDFECKTKYERFAVACDEKLNCEAYTGSSLIANSDYVWTFRYLYQPIMDPRTKEWTTWTGIDVQFVQPGSLSDGFHDQYHAAQFTDVNGNASNLKIFHFKK